MDKTVSDSAVWFDLRRQRDKIWLQCARSRRKGVPLQVLRALVARAVVYPHLIFLGNCWDVERSVCSHLRKTPVNSVKSTAYDATNPQFSKPPILPFDFCPYMTVFTVDEVASVLGLSKAVMDDLIRARIFKAHGVLPGRSKTQLCLYLVWDVFEASIFCALQRTWSKIRAAEFARDAVDALAGDYNGQAGTLSCFLSRRVVLKQLLFSVSTGDVGGHTAALLIHQLSTCFGLLCRLCDRAMLEP